MEILVISDTHGRSHALQQVRREFPYPDYLFHLGDIMGEETEIAAMFSCPARFVAGNNDFFSDLPRELILNLAGHRLLLTHGHRYSPYRNTVRLREAARRRRCDLVLFGHTHVPLFEAGTEKEPVTVINPGSLTFPRQANGRPSYIRLHLPEKGEIAADICYLQS